MPSEIPAPIITGFAGALAVIEGTVLLAAMFIIIANIVVDIVYAYLDPRVRYS